MKPRALARRDDAADADLAARPFDVDRALAVVRRRTPLVPRAALVLGSGLGVVAEGTAWKAEVPYHEIPGLPRSTVAGHAGRLLLGTWAGRPVAIAQGRSHLYEGHSPEGITRMVRLLAALGAKALVLTNASGGIATRMAPGTLVVIEDQVNLQWRSPIRGEAPEGSAVEGAAALGRGFAPRPVYDAELLAKAIRAAAIAGVPVERGVLGVMLGPSYETPAEITMLERLGADVVCMSTAPEAVVAASLGLPCIAISCVTNWAAGRSAARLSHDDVTKAVAGAAVPLKAMLERLVVSIV
ncbi:MAG TPA: purine-nucleoside phosphorylase [Candidatus Eisenbacteria bacterium]|nr:purine-nucleoside phosphorylase [Candidatus Eisenbacteria bacterium]